MDELGPQGAKAFTFGAGSERFALFVQCWNGAIFAYENACPHKRLPLDWRPGKFLAPEGKHLMCANHGALFRVDDGLCVAGPCMGERLGRITVRIDRGMITVGGQDAIRP